MHPGFFRCPVTLSVVATLTASNQIIPRRLPSTRAWKHVIESQLRRRILGAAVLASRVVAEQNVLARERTAFKRNVDVFHQANNRRCMDRELLRMEHVSVVLLHSRYSLKDHHHCAPFGAHVDGLE